MATTRVLLTPDDLTVAGKLVEEYNLLATLSEQATEYTLVCKSYVGRYAEDRKVVGAIESVERGHWLHTTVRSAIDARRTEIQKLLLDKYNVDVV